VEDIPEVKLCPFLGVIALFNFKVKRQCAFGRRAAIFVVDLEFVPGVWRLIG
jgi:hypothetical protein